MKGGTITNELSTQNIQLPDTLDDLARFALIGREKLNAVRAEIRAIEKVGLAKEVHEQKLVEAQEIAEAVLDAEVKIGELTSKIQKATKNNARKQIDNGVDLFQPKSEKLSEIGIPLHTAERFEQLAKHPEIVERAKQEARARGEVVTRSDAISRIQNEKKLETIESKGSDALREQVRTGKLSINQAYNSVCPKRPDPVKQAQEEHKAFQEQKKEAVVDFQSAQVDKINQKIINNALYQEILKLLDNIDKFGITHKISELKELQISKDDRKRLLERCESCRKIILQIESQITED